MSIRTITVTVALFAAVALQACQTEEDFGECILTDKMLSDCNEILSQTQDQCSGDEAFCGATCIVTDHPQCLYGPCLMYKYRDIKNPANWKTDPFCGNGCASTLDCPPESTCRELLSLRKQCSEDSECQRTSPWAVCEEDGFCTWKTCIPDAFSTAIVD